MIKRVVALIAAIVGALLVSLAPAVAIPDTPAAATPTFDFVHHSTPTASVVTERGPPGAHDPPAAYDYDAGDRWSPGAFVRSERAASYVAYTYDDNARLAQVARGVPSTERRVQATRAISGAFSRGGVAANGGALVKYDADFAIGQLTKGGRGTASGLVDLAESQGWKAVQSSGGPLKYFDSNGIERLVIKRGSARTPGSDFPHVAIRNASGQRVDPYGNLVTRKSPGNHTPIAWDLP